MGTTNMQLFELAKVLSLTSFHCICKDEFYKIDTTITNPLNIIVNLNDSDNNVNCH